MKFKCTLSSMGVTWLERFVPIFEKMERGAIGAVHPGDAAPCAGCR